MHVFLSFYGKDIRGKFTSHLYKALVDIGIKTFKDDHELNKGHEISSGLLNAIRDSKMFVVVLSQNYAHSTWCLDELVEILCCKKTEHQVVPVFYYVDPSDLQYQKRSFKGALEVHKKRLILTGCESLRKFHPLMTELTGLFALGLEECIRLKELAEPTINYTRTYVFV